MMNPIKTIDPKNVSTGEMHGYLLGAVAPRPVAFVSTVDSDGVVNLSPFSFFNCFSANPPILVFSPARRVRDNTTKHTFQNVHEVGEVVVNIVNHDIVEQMSLASTEYDKGVNEFEKSGLTAVPSERVKPPRVGESPAAFECVVRDIVSLGEEGGAGSLVICEVVLAHISEKIIDTNGKIDPFKLDAVARMGGNWYARASGDALFEIPKPIRTKGIGVDQIPDTIRNSDILTGNNLGRLGNVEQLPDEATIHLTKQSEEVKTILNKEGQPMEIRQQLHQLAKSYLENGDVATAWKILLIEA